MLLQLLTPLAFVATNHTNLQCSALQDIALDSSAYLQKYPNVGSPDACSTRKR